MSAPISQFNTVTENNFDPAVTYIPAIIPDAAKTTGYGNVRIPATAVAGAKWHSGSGIPDSSLGVNGDWYINTTNGYVYNKSGGLWGYKATLKGADGTNGISAKEIYYSISGVLTVNTGKLKRYISTAHTILAVKILLGTAAVGTSIKLDILKNGVSHSVLETDAEIPQNATTHTINVFTDNTLAVDDYLTVNISQVGSSVSGSDMTITIILT